MSTKLTLTMNDNVIKEAKFYAKNHHLSLSKMIEFYLTSITDNFKDKKLKKNIPPITRSLSGVISTQQQCSDKELLTEALLKKYL